MVPLAIVSRLWTELYIDLPGPDEWFEDLTAKMLAMNKELIQNRTEFLLV